MIISASCVDARRLEEVGGVLIDAKRKGNRPECGCFESRDIGEYDTCPHGCVYCYAVRRPEVARERYKMHDPEGEYLYRAKEEFKENIEYPTLNFE